MDGNRETSVAEKLIGLFSGSVFLVIALFITGLMVINNYQINANLLGGFIEGKSDLGQDAFTGEMMASLGLGDVTVVESIAFCLSLCGVVGITFLASRLREGLLFQHSRTRNRQRAPVLRVLLVLLPVAVILSLVLAFDGGLYASQMIIKATEEAEAIGSLNSGILAEKSIFEREHPLDFIENNRSNLGGFLAIIVLTGWVGLTFLAPVLLEQAWHGFKRSLINIIDPSQREAEQVVEPKPSLKAAPAPIIRQHGFLSSFLKSEANDRRNML